MVERLELNDIQGIVRSAYGHLPAAAYVLLRFDPAYPADVARWFAALAPHITTSEKKREDDSLNIALTSTGLRNLGVAAETVNTFSVAFVDGMTSKRRAAILGDHDPADWGGADDPIDGLLLVYARDERSLDARLGQLVADATAGHVHARTLRAGVYPDRREHFGFVDGISQPILESLRPKNEKQLVDERDIIKDGEIVLGYTNEYGYRAEAPRLGPNGELGRNGSYLVLRQMTQDVAGFRRFIDANAAGDGNARELLAAKIVGRWKNGAPLVKAPVLADPAYAVTVPNRAARLRANDFGFAQDLEGTACPLGAHIRRANPRDASTLDTPDESLRRTARHRLLRRGRSYGPRIDDPNATPQSERGLYFIALCADIERQFEFIVQTWINNPAFNDLDETDPLVGHPGVDATLTIQAPIVRRRIRGLQTFVQFVGGAYFFVPSIAAIRWLARTAMAPPPATPRSRAHADR